MFDILKDFETQVGLKAVIVQTDIGHNCGYVGINGNNLLFGKGYSEHLDCLNSLYEKALNEPIGDKGIIPMVCHQKGQASMDVVLDVHGSITYSRGNTDYPIESDLWWIGFDCGHAGDNPQIQDLSFCIKECEKLAKQIFTLQKN